MACTDGLAETQLRKVPTTGRLTGSGFLRRGGRTYRRCDRGQRPSCPRHSAPTTPLELWGWTAPSGRICVAGVPSTAPLAPREKRVGRLFLGIRSAQRGRLRGAEGHAQGLPAGHRGRSHPKLRWCRSALDGSATVEPAERPGLHSKKPPPALCRQTPQREFLRPLARSAVGTWTNWSSSEPGKSRAWRLPCCLPLPHTSGEAEPTARPQQCCWLSAPLAADCAPPGVSRATWRWTQVGEKRPEGGGGVGECVSVLALPQRVTAGWRCIRPA